MYLSSDNKTISAEDRLLATVNFDAGLAPGESRKKTSKVLIPFNGLSGNYHFGAKVGNRSRVSAKQALIVRFTVDTNGKVTDHKTDLTWQQSDDGVKKDWVSAVAYCSNLTLGGSTNWRLPSIAELQTIVDYSQTYPATDPVFACRSSNYWSSTPVTISPDYPWYINFTDGYSYWSGKSTLSYVRCVRGISW